MDLGHECDEFLMTGKRVKTVKVKKKFSRTTWRCRKARM
jgi:argonaute-like protein implicated in RNA metabolism and viral defense